MPKFRKVVNTIAYIIIFAIAILMYVIVKTLANFVIAIAEFVRSFAVNTWRTGKNAKDLVVDDYHRTFKKDETEEETEE